MTEHTVRNDLYAAVGYADRERWPDAPYTLGRTVGDEGGA
jgi:hypothetical protein